MNTKEFLINAVTTNTELNIMQKNVMIADINRMHEDKSINDSLRNAINVTLSDTSRITELFEVDDQYVIFKCVTKHDEYYRTFDKVKKQTFNEVSRNLHHQILITLGVHHDGINQRFSGYAARMLQIEN
jgi:hypothetical protein